MCIEQQILKKIGRESYAKETILQKSGRDHYQKITDAVANTPPGFNAIVFCFLGLLAVLVTKHLFNNNIISAITLCVLCALLYFLLRWIFCYAFSLSFTENLTYIINTVIPSCVFTAIFIIPFYYLEKALYKKFY